MSQMMKALRSSEQGYSANAQSAYAYSSQQTSNEPSGFRWYYLALVAAPGLITIAWLSYQAVQEQQQKIAQVTNSPAAIEQVSAPYQRLAFPDFGELQSTYLADNQSQDIGLPSNTEAEEQSAESVSEVATQALVQNSESLALDGIDLSELSPALALRVESALKTQSDNLPEQIDHDDSSAVKLLQHADSYMGRLPAMDFQTHVYASNANKRWIKMNGVEYQEGDQLFDGIQLVAINPQTTVIRFEQQLIEVPALYHWQG